MSVIRNILLATAATAAVAGGGLYLYDRITGKNIIKRNTLHLADKATDVVIDKLDDLAKTPEEATSLKPHVLLSYSPGVAVMYKDYPVFVGLDTTSVELGTTVPRESMDQLLRWYFGESKGDRISKQIPGKPYVALRISPALIPFEAGVAIGKGDARKAKRLMAKVKNKIRDELTSLKEVV